VALMVTSQLLMPSVIRSFAEPERGVKCGLLPFLCEGMSLRGSAILGLALLQPRVSSSARSRMGSSPWLAQASPRPDRVVWAQGAQAIRNILIARVPATRRATAKTSRCIA